MSKEAYIFEVSQKSFNQYILLNSHKIPVVVEFMGVWSEPSVVMSDLFAGLAQEFAEEFIFAKVDIDEQVELRDEFEIKNIPTLIVFKDGKPVRREVGQLQEVEARSLLKDFGIYHEADMLREQARNKHLQGDTSAAILMLTDAIKKDSSNVRVVMDMVQIFIDIGEYDQAAGLFERLPDAAKQTEMGKALSGQLAFIELSKNTAPADELSERLSKDEHDYAAHFDSAIRMVTLYEYEQAMEHLFFIIGNDMTFKEGAAKEMIITVTNMIAPVNHDMAQQFRSRLANILAA